MAIKTVKIDTVAAFCTDHKDWWVITDMIQPHVALIDNLETVKEDGLKITFKKNVKWHEIVFRVAQMKADEVWETTEDKTVTLWWD